MKEYDHGVLSVSMGRYLNNLMKGLEMASRSILVFLPFCCLVFSLAAAAQTPYDVDVTLTNSHDKDFTNLPVFLKVADVFGRGVDYTKFTGSFRIMDADGGDVPFMLRRMPPHFSLANDELLIVLPALAKDGQINLRVLHEPAVATEPLHFDAQAILDNPNNMVFNGGFEKGGEGWEGGKIVQDVVHSGKNALLLEAPAKGGRDAAKCLTQLSFVKGKPYYFHVWARSQNVVRHSYRWPAVGGKIFLSGDGLGLSTHHGDKSRHERIMDDREWYPYRAGRNLAINTVDSELRITLNQVYKAFVDPEQPARIWIDDVLAFPQPEFSASTERIAKILAPEGSFVYRRAVTCTAGLKRHIPPARPYEQIACISESALQGERKCLTLGYFTTRPLPALVLELSDLAGPKGGIFSAADFEVEFNYYPADVNEWKLSPTSLEGWCIDGNVPRDVDRPGSVDWFIGIRVPFEAAPGTYTGEIKIKSGDNVLAVVPLKLEIFNLPLAVITDRFMGEIYNDGCGPEAITGAVLPPRNTAYYSYYRRCNFTMMMMFSRFLPFKGSSAEVDLDKLKVMMTEMRDVAGCSAGVGLYWDVSLDQQGRKGGPYGGRGLWTRVGRNRDKYRVAIKQLDDALAEAKLPRLIYMVWDEPRFYDNRISILKGTGALTTADIFSDEMIACLKDHGLTHTSCDDPSMEPGPMTYKWVRSLGIRWGMAGWPSQHCTRYQTGMLYAVSDMNYWHHWYGNQFIGFHKHHNAFVRGSNVAGMGEGMIDLRYFETLKSLMAQAKEQGVATEEVAAAEKYLQSIFDYCTGDWHWVGVYNGTAQQWGDDWFYDRWRDKMRKAALSIKAKLN